MTLRLDLLRHGETELGGGLRGSLDDALTEKGWQQMRDAVIAGALGSVGQFAVAALRTVRRRAGRQLGLPVIWTRICRSCISAPGKGRAPRR
jgi:alpha-ribazole phosphatase